MDGAPSQGRVQVGTLLCAHMHLAEDDVLILEFTKSIYVGVVPNITFCLRVISK